MSKHTHTRIRPNGFSTAVRGTLPCWTQAVSCRIPTAKVRARFHASECGNCGDSFSPSNFVYPCWYHSTYIPYSHITNLLSMPRVSTIVNNCHSGKNTLE